MWSKSSQMSVVVQEPRSCEETAFTDRYEVLWPIGLGGFAQVKLARHLLTGAEVAVKVLPKAGQAFQVLLETDVMRSLEHPNVIQLFQVIETRERIYIAMEYAGGGQLFQHVPPGGLKEKEARSLFRQVACAVGYCHGKGIVHGDVKAQNILLDDRGSVKLIDFGMSMRFTPGQKLNKFQGTRLYLPPEVLLQQEHEGPPVDVWSLGVLLYFMLTGTYPFPVSLPQELDKRIFLARYHVPRRISRKAQGLIGQMLNVDPTQRPTVEQVLCHPWLRKGEKDGHLRHSEPFPKHPDPAVMAVLVDTGYDPYETWVSLANGRFDDTAATYLLLQHQIRQGAGCVFQGKPVHVRGGSHSHPTPLPRASASECALHTFPLPCEPQLHEEAKEPGHRAFRSVSLPVTDVCSLHAKTPAPGIASQHHLVSHRPKSWRILSRQLASTKKPHHSHQGWRGLTGRMASCFQQLCCCLPCISHRVVPVNERQKHSRFQNRVAPGQ